RGAERPVRLHQGRPAGRPANPGGPVRRDEVAARRPHVREGDRLAHQAAEPRMTPDAELLSTREGYDRWAAVYDTDGNPVVALEEPLVDALLGDVRGLAVLDVGCGTGRHALRLAAAGASVDAIDFSQEMLARARAKPGADKVMWRTHD